MSRSPKTPRARLDKCPFCQKPWENHPGISATCKRLREAVSALQLIHTWATDGGLLLNPGDVLRLTEKVLKEIGGEGKV